MTESREAASDFESIFDSGYRRLARLLYRVTGDTARAEEVASEALWRLHRNPPKEENNIEGWLYRTGLRLALDAIRRDRRRARYEALASFFGGAIDPQRVLEQNEERERVRRTLAAIRTDQASLILLRADGLSYDEIATALHLNRNSVGTLLARAEQAFRKEYVKRYGQPARG